MKMQQLNGDTEKQPQGSPANARKKFEDKSDSESVFSSLSTAFRGESQKDSREAQMIGRFATFREALSKPSVLITVILLMILMLMSFEYGHMQHRMTILERQLKVMKTKEAGLNHQISWLRGDVTKV